MRACNKQKMDLVIKEQACFYQIFVNTNIDNKLNMISSTAYKQLSVLVWKFVLQD